MDRLERAAVVLVVAGATVLLVTVTVMVLSVL